MSEGKYGRLPKPKDRTRVAVRVGDVSLAPIHDKASEWEEEDDSYHAHAKPAPREESMSSRIARALGDFAKQASATVGNGYSSLLKKEDEQ